MISRPSRESIMEALYAVLQAALAVNFTADTTQGSAVLSAPSNLAGLTVGLPVFGGSIPAGATIATLTPTLTLSAPAAEDGTAVALLCGVQTFGRRLIHWTQVAAQPALFLRDGRSEDLDYEGIILQRQTLRAEIWLYSNAGQDPTTAPSIVMNYLLDAVQAALAPDDQSTARFTLGGLVEWCRIAGRLDKEPGDLDGQALAVADVEITVP